MVLTFRWLEYAQTATFANRNVYCGDIRNYKSGDIRNYKSTYFRKYSINMTTSVEGYQIT